jgi:hypothetical protein
MRSVTRPRTLLHAGPALSVLPRRRRWIFHRRSGGYALHAIRFENVAQESTFQKEWRPEIYLSEVYMSRIILLGFEINLK